MLTFESSLTDEEIAENFKNISFFDGLMNGLNEALAYEKDSAKAETYARKCTPSPTAKKLIHLLSIDPTLVQKL